MFKGNDINMFSVDNKETRTTSCSKLAIKRPEWRHWRQPDVFIVNFKHEGILSLILTLNIFLNFFQCFYCCLWTGKIQWNTCHKWITEIISVKRINCMSEIFDIYANQSYLYGLHWLMYHRPWNAQYNENWYKSARAEYSISLNIIKKEMYCQQKEELIHKVKPSFTKVRCWVTKSHWDVNIWKYKPHQKTLR